MFRAVFVSNVKKLNKLHKLSNLTYSKYVITLHRTLSISSIKYAKLFVDRENEHCFGIITSLSESKKPLFLDQQTEDISMDVFNSTLKQNFRQSNASTIVSTFATLQPFATQHNILLSDHRFDNLVDGLMDYAEKLSDQELQTLLLTITKFPPANTINDHNFNDVWNCLDDMCCRRLPNWNEDTIFAVAHSWYLLKLSKICNFIYKALDKMSRKPERLSKDQLVNAFFLMSVTRKTSVHFEYEHALSKKMDEMNVDELAIAALGYFKTQTKVKIPTICSEMLRKAKEAGDMHDISLCAILKTVRYTSPPTLADQILDFLEYITPKLPQLSTLCVLHASLLGTTIQVLHEPSLKFAAQRIASNISNTLEVRLKDIERLLLALTMFNYDPKTMPCIYEASLNELHEERRNQEMIRHRNCLGAALSFLSIRNVYSVELLKKALDPEIITEFYGDSAKMYPRELFVLNMNTYIDLDGYDGPRLDRVKQIKVSKWLTKFTPTADSGKKLTALDKLILDVMKVIGEVVGGEEKLFVEHLLPHYIRSDIVICQDKSTKKFIKPQGFDCYEFGELMWAPKDDTKNFLVFSTVGWNGTVRGTSNVVGLVHMKMRHLRKMGYLPCTVIWNEYSALSNKEKKNYIEDKIKECTA